MHHFLLYPYTTSSPFLSIYIIFSFYIHVQQHFLQYPYKISPSISIYNKIFSVVIYGTILRIQSHSKNSWCRTSCYTIMKGITTNPLHVYVHVQVHIFCYTAIWYKTCPVSVGLGTAVIAVGQSVRIGVSVLSVLGTEFSTKERLFIAMARFPKATVQVSKSFYNAKENYR